MFLFGFEPGLQSGYLALVLENGMVGQVKKVVQKLNPVRHLHQNLTLRPVLRQIKEGRDDLVQFLYVGLTQVIFGNRDIGF